jgi:hypothetical protein
MSPSNCYEVNKKMYVSGIVYVLIVLIALGATLHKVMHRCYTRMKNAQKSEKNITSETINKIIPNLNPFELL